jgi:hypothetical protein
MVKHPHIYDGAVPIGNSTVLIAGAIEALQSRIKGRWRVQRRMNVSDILASLQQRRELVRLV